MKIKAHNIVAILGGLLLIVGFFMPYIDFIMIQMSGFTMISKIIGNETFGMMGMKTDQRIVSLIIWGLFPVTGLLSIIGGIFNKKYLVLTAAILLTLDVSLIITAVATKGQNPFITSYYSFVGNGLRLSLLGMAFMLAYGAVYRTEEAKIHKPVIITSGIMTALFALAVAYYNIALG